MPVDLHRIDGVDGRLLAGLPGVLVLKREVPEAGWPWCPQNPYPWEVRAGAGCHHPAAHDNTHPQGTAKEGLQEGRLAHSSGPHHFAQENVPLRLSLFLVQRFLTGDCGKMARTSESEGLPGWGWARPVRGQGPTCDGMGLRILLAEDGVAQVAKVFETALDVQVGHQAGAEVGGEGIREGRWYLAGGGRWGLCLRPLAEVPVQGQPACFGADRVQELGAPGGSWEHAEEALQLCRREGAITVLQAEGLR